MNTIYLYTLNDKTLFSKISKFIMDNYNNISVYGTNDASLLQRDIIVNTSTRHICNICLILPKFTSQKDITDLELVVNSIVLFQNILQEKVPITIFLGDPNIRSKLAGLSEFNTKVVAYQGNITDKLIVSGLVYPILSEKSFYEDSNTKQNSTISNFQQNIPSQTSTKAPEPSSIPSAPSSLSDYSSNAKFVDTMISVNTDLETLYMRMETDKATLTDTQQALDNFDLIMSNPEKIKDITLDNNSSFENILNKLASVETQLDKATKEYNSDCMIQRKTELAKEIRLLKTQKEALLNTSELMTENEKLNILDGSVKNVKETVETQLRSFNEAIKEAKANDSITHSKEVIEQLTDKRVTMMRQLNQFSIEESTRLKKLDVEVTSEINKLSQKAKEGIEEYKTLTNDAKTNPNSESIASQLQNSKLELEVLSKQLMRLKDIKSDLDSQQIEFKTKVNEVISHMGDIIGLDTTLIEEYKTLTKNLEQTKSINLVVNNELAVKLETFVGTPNVGKTAVAYYYALALSSSNKRICMIDLDIDTPELYHYVQRKEVNSLESILHAPNNYDFVNQMKLDNNIAYVVNTIRHKKMLKEASIESESDLLSLLNEKLNILVKCFDKIIILAELQDNEVVSYLHNYSGTFTCVTDINPSSLEELNTVVTTLHTINSDNKLYRVIFNTYSNEDVKVLTTRLSFPFPYRNYNVPVISKLPETKFSGDTLDIYTCKAFTILTK